MAGRNEKTSSKAAISVDRKGITEGHEIENPVVSLIRDYIASDRAAVEEMAGRGSLPDLDRPGLIPIRLVADRDGRPVMVLLGKATLEFSLAVDRSSTTPLQRWGDYLALDGEAESQAVARGFTDSHLHLAPELLGRRGYIRRLETRLNWRPEHECWWKRLSPKERT
jgi:hypothetical protein